MATRKRLRCQTVSHNNRQLRARQITTIAVLLISPVSAAPGRKREQTTYHHLVPHGTLRCFGQTDDAMGAQRNPRHASLRDTHAQYSEEQRADSILI